jgi:hypothetical protein
MPEYKYPYNDTKWNGINVWITPLHPLREGKVTTWFQDGEAGALLITEGDEGNPVGVLEVYDTDLKKTLGILYWSDKPQGANTSGRAVWKPEDGIKLNAREKKIVTNVLDLYHRRKELGIAVLGA